MRKSSLFLFLFIVIIVIFVNSCSNAQNTPKDSQDYSCNFPSDCESKNLGHERCLGSWTCESNQCKWECETQGPQKDSLRLEADISEGDAPLSVTFIATLTTDKEERFYCPDIAWDFGDGEGYAAMPSCMPYDPSVEIQKMFTFTHEYTKPGIYTAEFKLKNIESNKIKINIKGIDPAFACSKDSDCKPSGCSSQVCANKNTQITTTCEYNSAYDCLKLTKCSCVENLCQWEKNDAYQGCLEEKSQPVPLF